MNLNNKTVLITGASSGIGASFAYLLASKGANLVLVARSKDKMERIAHEIKEQHQVAVSVIQKDLSVPQSGNALFEEVQAQSLDIDIIINNAGFGKWGKFEAFDMKVYESMIQLNITSLTELCYCFLDHLKSKTEAGIINVGSTASFIPVPYSAVYGATKSYVLNFTEALVGELESTKVMVSCLCPAGTESNFSTVANANKVDNAPEELMSSDEVAQIGLDAFL
ncbi:MAG: SDR family oxidoreductase, partial [Saprospiraceae bacterium]|nr:SDR family oxidoreductase [Saprospiraceae bacterium]